MLRKSGITLLIILMMLSIFVGCSTSQEETTTEESSATTEEKVEEVEEVAKEPVTITFYSYNLGHATFGAGTEKLIKEFMELNPHITVEGVAVPGAEINAKVQADLVAGNPPDVAQLIFDGLDHYVTNFNAKPIETIASKEDIEQHFEGFSPNGLKLGQLNGQTYGVAFTFSTPVLFYNANILKAAGLDPENPPTTWKEVKEYATAIVDKTDAEGVYIAGLAGFDWIIQSLIASNGGNVLSSDRKNITFAQPEAIEAISMWQDLVKSGVHSTLTAGEIMETMFKGNLGMYLQTSAVQNTMIKNSQDNQWELRAAAMPSFDVKPTAPVNSGSALFILSDDVAKQQAAWEFLKFVTSARGYTIITSEIGYLPLRPAIVDDPQYLKPWVEANPLVKPNLEQLERLTAWQSYPGPNWRQIENILLEATEKAVNTDGNVTEIMTEAQTRAQELLQ